MGDIRIAICTGLAATWCVAASAQQMLPPSGGDIGSPPAVGFTRGLPPQAQSIAPAYSPPGSPAMPVITGPAAMPVPALGGTQQVLLTLVARFGRDVPTQITNGLLWRVFPARPDVGGKF